MQFVDLIFLFITLGIGFVLYLRLGRRTGHEKRFFYPPSEELQNVTPQSGKTEIIHLLPVELSDLREIQKHDRKFSLDDFSERIKDAFEKIVKAFVEGDKKALSAFLKDKLYALYEKEIDLLKEQETTTHLEFFRLVSAEVKKVRAQDEVAHIQVHFVSEQTQLRKNSAEKVVAGDANFIDRISELWTFERPLKSKGPWMLSGITPHEAG